MKNLLKKFFTDNAFRFRLVFLGCVGLLGAGFVLQYLVGLTPCPLCILQRFLFALVGITALVGALRIKNPDQDARAFGALMILFSLLGGALAVRQIWLQHNPPSLLGSNCAPWLGSLTNLIASVFHATADCAERGWTLLYLSIPEWSLISFVALALIGTLFFRTKP